MSELSVPIIARLGTTECEVGRLIINGEDVAVDVATEKLRLAREVFAGLTNGES